jgi:tectonic-1/3
MCIVQDNNAELSKYFTDPGVATSANLVESRTLNIGRAWLPDPTAVAASEALVTALDTNSAYRFNDTVRLSSKLTSPGGVWTLPGATFTGECDWVNVVGFGMRLPNSITKNSSTCVVPMDGPLEDIKDKCLQGTLNAALVTTSLRIANTKASSPSAITPIIQYVRTESTVGGLVADVNAASQTTAWVAETASTPDKGICTNAIKEAHFEVTSDAAGTITMVTVAVTYADAVPIVSGDAAARGSSTTNFWNTEQLSSSPIGFTQKFSVTWKTTGESPIPKSGSSGYVVGAPLLAGYQDTSGSKSAVLRLKDGLQLPAAGPNGVCSANAKSTVRFGKSQMSSCAIPLTKAALATFCGGSGTTYADAYLYQSTAYHNGLSVKPTDASPSKETDDRGAGPTVLSLKGDVPITSQLMDGLLWGTADATLNLDTQTVMIAGWADADATNIADWKGCSTTDTTDCGTVFTSLTAPSTSMSWDATTLTCSNVAVGYDITILTQKVGTLDNPQYKVARVAIDWIYDDWQWQDNNQLYTVTTVDATALGGDTADQHYRQNFPLKSSVRFVEAVQDSAVGVTPAKPSVFPSLSSDFFYPFLSAGPSGGRAGATAAWCVAIAVAFLVACLTARGNESY